EAGDAAFPHLLLREDRPGARFAGARGRAQRRRPAPGARDVRQARALEHDGDFPGRSARVHHRVHRGQRAPLKRDLGTISFHLREAARVKIMRIRVTHEIVHRFAPPARTINQMLRLTPLSFDSQYVLRWRVAVDADGALRHVEDAHGNAVSSYSHHGLIEHLTVLAAGEVETSDAAGVVRGAVERLPPEMYLRDSRLAHVNGALRG